MVINRFSALNTRILIIGCLFAGLTALITLWPEGEPPSPVGQVKAPDTSGNYRSRLPGPEQVQPDVRYGTAAPPRVRETGRQWVPAVPSYDRYPGNDAAPYGPVESQPNLRERFTFRPLTDRERERLEADRPAPYYGGPTPMEPSARPYPEWYDQPEPSRYYPTPAYPDRRGGGYSFRPSHPGTEARDQRAEPYSDWGNGQDYQNQWAAPPATRWGSQPHNSPPPARRMYPRLDDYEDRRFTAR